jgi:hypothetical protein
MGLTLAALLIQPAASAEIVELERDARPDLTQCAVVLNFGSHALGPPADASTLANVYIVSSKKISKALFWRWGKEGEHSYCLFVGSAVDAKTVFHELCNAMPKKLKNGYLNIVAHSTAGEASFERSSGQ